MKNLWTIVCQNSISDDYSKRLSLINILDAVRLNVTDENLLKLQENKVDYLYAKSMRFCIVSNWQRQDASKQELKKYRISMLDSKEKVLKQYEHSMKFKQNVLSLNSRFFVQGLRFTGSGTYYIVMEKEAGLNEWIETIRVPLKVLVNVKKTPVKSRVNNLVN